MGEHMRAAVKNVPAMYGLPQSRPTTQYSRSLLPSSTLLSHQVTRHHSAQIHHGQLTSLFKRNATASFVSVSVQ